MMACSFVIFVEEAVDDSKIDIGNKLASNVSDLAMFEMEINGRLVISRIFSS